MRELEGDLGVTRSLVRTPGAAGGCRRATCHATTGTKLYTFRSGAWQARCAEIFADEEKRRIFKAFDAALRDAKLPDKTTTLSRKLAALLLGVDAASANSWAGSFGDSPGGTPTIGRIPDMPNCYAAMGYSIMAAQMLRGLICGYGDPDSGLVSFHRKF